MLGARRGQAVVFCAGARCAPESRSMQRPRSCVAQEVFAHDQGPLLLRHLLWLP